MYAKSYQLQVAQAKWHIIDKSYQEQVIFTIDQAQVMTRISKFHGNFRVTSHITRKG